MSDGKNLEAHVFVCTNKREKGAHCGQKGSEELRNKLKAMCQDEQRGWHGRVRINASGCLGRCEEGIVAVMYPKAQWFTKLTKDNVTEVEAALKEVLD